MSMSDFYLLLVGLLFALLAGTSSMLANGAGDVSASEYQKIVAERDQLASNFRELQSTYQKSVAERDQLKIKIHELQSKFQELGAERDQLTSKIVVLKQDIDVLVDSLGSDRAQLARQLHETQLELAQVRGELKSLRSDYDILSTSNISMKLQLERLKKQIVSLEADLADCIADGEIDPDVMLRLQKRIESLQIELAKCKADDEGNGEVAKELLGLKGKLSKVVFLLDRSSSMANSGRWETAAATVTDWLKHLGMDQVAIITFGTQVEAFPDAGSFLPADDPRLVEFVQKVPVSGQTATFGALYLAFSEYADCDTFLVFTDGEPSPGFTGNTDKSAVIRLVKDQLKPSQTINVIGIGDYFSKSMRDFVKSLANHGRGAFIGR